MKISTATYPLGYAEHQIGNQAIIKTIPCGWCGRVCLYPPYPYGKQEEGWWICGGCLRRMGDNNKTYDFRKEIG